MLEKLAAKPVETMAWNKLMYDLRPFRLEVTAFPPPPPPPPPPPKDYASLIERFSGGLCKCYAHSQCFCFVTVPC